VVTGDSEPSENLTKEKNKYLHHMQVRNYRT